MDAHNFKIACPTCNQEVIFTVDNRFRPFCSDRCRLIDLGEWLSEKNVVPGSDILE